MDPAGPWPIWKLNSICAKLSCSRSFWLLFFCNALGQNTPDNATFRRHPNNPRCFLYKGQLIVLVTATEHYGAVLNGQFDFIPYLDELARNGLNLSRTFTFYRELEDSIPPLGYTNTLAPRPGHEVMPWKTHRTGQSKRWWTEVRSGSMEPGVLRKIQGFLKAAADRDVIVEIVFFWQPNNLTTPLWSWFPLHPNNNINAAGAKITEVGQFMEEHDPSIFERQKKVRSQDRPGAERLRQHLLRDLE